MKGAALAGLVLLCACAPRAPAPEEYRAFSEPRRVTIRGYGGDAMEPFVSRDGRYLFFNNRNDPRVNTNLHYASRLDELTFQYRGEMQGVNTAALEGVPSLDASSNLYFISTRSYGDTLSTLYRGRFDAGTVSRVELVEGVSLRQAGMVMFDAEISADGETLWVVDGRFTGGPHPRSADIALAQRDGRGFRRSPRSAEVLRHINTQALEYAPAVSGDGLELFFTRAESGKAAIYRAARASTQEAFSPPQRVSAATGFVEAPALSPDGGALYYHALEGGRFLIFRATR